MTSGTFGQLSSAASIRCLMNGSPAYLRAPALACRMTRAPASAGAGVPPPPPSRAAASGPRARPRLQDARRAALVGGGHHRLHLLEVVDVEGGDAIAVGGGMVEELAHRGEGHGGGLSARLS